MATYNKFEIFVQDVANGVHKFGTDQLTIALVSSANPPSSANSILTDLTQITYTNLSSRNITSTSSTETSGTYRLKVNDLILSASGTVAAFRYIIIYNSSSPSNSLICWFDYGSDVGLGIGDTFTIDFDNINGLFSIT